MKKLFHGFLIALTVFTTFAQQAPAATAVGLFGENKIVADVPETGNERLIAKGGALPNTIQSSASTYTKLECRGKITVGRQPAQNIRLGAWAGYISNGEVNAPNDIQIKFALERVSGGSKTVEFHFSGSASRKFLTPGQSVITEPINSSAFGLSNFAAGSQWRWRGELVVPSSSKWVYNYEGVNATTGFEVTAGETLCVKSNSTDSQLTKTGNLTTPSGGATTLEVFGPTVVVGDWVSTPDISLALVGDSVAANQTDGQDTGIDRGGFLARGARQATGGQIPTSLFARSSESVQAWVSSHTYRSGIFKYFTHWQDHLGGADGLNGRTQSQIVNDLKYVWDLFRDNAASPAYVTHSQIQPATTSASGNWTSAGDQTCISPISCGGQLRDLTNAAVLALEGDPTGPDKIFDPNLYWEDQSNLTKWVSTGVSDYATADGRHPSTALHDLAGDAYATFIDTYYSSGPPSNLSAPVVTGNEYVGSTLSCATGSWTGSPTGYTYAWEDAQGTISGATSSTFVVTNDQLGENTNCSVIAANASGSSSAIDSNVIDVFTPTDIGNMVAWYDASQASSISSTSGSVDAITDLVTGSNTCTATTTARPTTNSVQINSQNAIDFDGTNDRLTCGSTWGTGLLNDSDGATIYTVAATDSPMTAQQYLWSAYQGGGTIGGSGVGYSSPNYQAQGASGGGLASTTISSSTAAHAIAYRRGFGSAGTTQIIYDGVGTAGTTSVNFTATTFTIGNDGFSSGSKWWNGAMGEYFVYSRALTNVEMNKLGAYVASKWGISWTTLTYNMLYMPRYANDNDWAVPYRQVAANDNLGSFDPQQMVVTQ